MDHRFTKDWTNYIKGVAICLVLMHHILYQTYPFFSFLVTPQHNYLRHLVSMAKVCVYLFFIISGYGIWMSLERMKLSFKEAVKFVLRHAVKLYSIYWIIYIIFVPMGHFFGREPFSIYRGVSDLVWDFFGLAYLHGSPSFVPTWWYNSMTLLFYVCSPLVFLVMKRIRMGSWIGIVIVILCSVSHAGWRTSLIYCIPYLIGMAFGQFDVLRKVKNWMHRDRRTLAISTFMMVVLTCAYGIFRVAVMNQQTQYYYRYDWVLAILIILIVFVIFPEKGPVAKIFQGLGVHSGNIYMFHAFFYSFYFKSIVYLPRWSLLVYILFLAECVVISYILEKIKGWIRYKKLFAILDDQIRKI